MQADIDTRKVVESYLLICRQEERERLKQRDRQTDSQTDRRRDKYRCGFLKPPPVTYFLQ